MTLYPLGYDGPDEGTAVDIFGTLEDVAARLVKAHPEFRRRVLAAIVAADGLVGIGGGWRSTEAQTQLFLSRYYVDPNGSILWNGQRWSKKPGVSSAAPPGSSFHESQTFKSGTVGFQAVDIVGRDGDHHDDAWRWIAVNGGGFGLKDFTNVNSEPWHIQCTELPNSVASWKAAGSPDPVSPIIPPPVPEEPVDYFTLKAAPATLWQVIAPGVAVRIEGETWEARGHPLARVMSADEAAKFVFLGGLPAASTK